MTHISIAGALVGVIGATGLLSLVTSCRIIHQWERVIAISIPRLVINPQPAMLPRVLKKFLCVRPHSPWLSDELIAESLRRAASSHSIESFRRTQILYAGMFTCLFLVWTLLRTLGGKPMSPTLAVLAGSCVLVVGGWFARWNLRRTAAERLRLIEQELPIVTDLLAFAVSAGEPVIVALRRICLTCTGAFVHELQRVNAAIGSGIPLAEALTDMDKALGLAPVSRMVRAVTVALERGTPMAEVLRAQASDSRAEASRAMLVLAGKKETAMMIPVVFLILPLIVAVALYPGLIALNILHG